MNIKTILTTLILGTSSIAAADPIPFDARSDIYNERFDERFITRGVRGPAVLLAKNVPLSNNVQRTVFVPVNSKNAIDKLQIDIDGGQAYVDKLFVTFADGSRQSVGVRQTLSARNPSIVIDLDVLLRVRQGVGITGVYFYGESNATQNQGYGYASSARGTIDVVGISMGTRR